MAKRGRKPIGRTIEDLDAGLRAEIDEALRSSSSESASAIFRRFGLATRELRLDTFIRYAGRIRQQTEGEQIAAKLLSAENHLSEPELIARLRRMVLVDAVQRLQAGDSKLYETMSLLARIQDFDRIEIEKSAARRAAEKHEAWKATLTKQLHSTLDEASKQGKTAYTRADVYDLVDKIVRGQA